MRCRLHCKMLRTCCAAQHPGSKAAHVLRHSFRAGVLRCAWSADCGVGRKAHSTQAPKMPVLRTCPCHPAWFCPATLCLHACACARAPALHTLNRSLAHDNNAQLWPQATLYGKHDAFDEEVGALSQAVGRLKGMVTTIGEEAKETGKLQDVVAKQLEAAQVLLSSGCCFADAR